MADHLEAHGPYLLGAQRSAADFLLTMLIIAMVGVVFDLVGYCIAAMFLLLGRFY